MRTQSRGSEIFMTFSRSNMRALRSFLLGLLADLPNFQGRQLNSESEIREKFLERNQTSPSFSFFLFPFLSFSFYFSFRVLYSIPFLSFLHQRKIRIF